ncbi:hypothetical protein C1645_821764 [Glomus cerebriforme]|uniref:Uncharacterized protein n=1 Tax=Glomus cerebriforme TaxID=658196 RepID=A0A397T9P6_9GLOM|nr:hypothetical protein C1645_821764 [Glomus cerebriforme]
MKEKDKKQDKKMNGFKITNKEESKENETFLRMNKTKIKEGMNGKNNLNERMHKKRENIIEKDF